MPSMVHLIHRPRVTALLDAARDARLTLLCAPAGFGKSSALRDWLSDGDLPYAWLTLDRSHDDVGRFLRDALAAIAGDAAAPTAPLLATALGPAETASAILDAVPDTAGDFVLVLDDVHAVQDNGVIQAVQALVDAAPELLHVVLATREDPRLRLSRLRLDGELVELRAEQLRFTTEEAGALLARRMGVTLSPADVALLVERTEGWPAVLQLAALSMVGDDDPHAFVGSFAATHRLVLDFVTEEVLNRLDPPTTDFLLRTSVLDRLTGDLCDAVTGGTGGADTLDRLERANLLLSPVDESRTWFRYHRLFADLLRARARTTLRDDLLEMHHRAGSWCLQHGLAREALDHAVHGAAAGADPGLLDRAALALVHRGDLTALGGLDQVPPAAIPVGAALLRAWAGALTGLPERHVEQLLSAAVVAAERVAGPTPAFAESIGGYGAMLRSVLARRSRADDAVRLAEEGLALEPAALEAGERDLFRGNGLTVLGHALLAAGETDRAMAVYREALPLVQRVGNRLATAEMTRNLARLELAAGRAADARATCNGSLRRPLDPCDALVLLALAEVMAAEGDPEAASVASSARALALTGGDVATARAAEDLERAARAWKPSGAASGPSALTDREVEVLGLVARGMSNGDIARELFLTVGTVKSHLHAVAVALGTTNRVAAVARARELGILD